MYMAQPPKLCFGYKGSGQLCGEKRDHSITISLQNQVFLTAYKIAISK
jgi:hypothetical protein